MRKLKVVVGFGSIPFLFLFLCMSLFPSGSFCNPGQPLWAAAETKETPLPPRNNAPSTEVQRQLKLAISLYSEMEHADEWDLEVFIRNHRRVIDECPETPMAIESCWRLSNLYLTGKRVAEPEIVIDLMEHALAKYPGNRWEDRFVRRLIQVLQDTGEFRKLLALCQARLASPHISGDDKTALHFWAAHAAEGLGETNQAADHFQRVLDGAAAAQPDSSMAAIARNHLTRLQGGPATSPDGN